MLERSRKILKRIVSGSQDSKPLEVSKQEKKFNPRTRKDAEEMSDKENMDAGYKGKYTPMEWMEIFNVLVGICTSITVCLDIDMEIKMGSYFSCNIAKQKFIDGNPPNVYIED